MVCIYCSGETSVKNSRRRTRGFATWRRRQCQNCLAIYTTSEVPELDSALRIRKNSVLEPFVYEKLLLDMYSSLGHRKTAYTDARQLTSTILVKLLPAKTGVLKSTEIKNTVLEVLKPFDLAAFTYFEAHHG